MTSGELRLLQQDAQLLVVHKPAGWTMYAEDGVSKDLHLQPICQDLFMQKLFPVHRLDRATCGIVIFATDGRWARELHEQFAGRKISKTYLALVEGSLDKPRCIDIALKEKGKGEQSAVTNVKVKKKGNLAGMPVTLLELTPETGRFHQLRKHCKLIGHPIIGDTIYGKEKTNQLVSNHVKNLRLMLSAVGLKFSHPRTRKEMRIVDTPDVEFVELLKAAKISL
jgi:tRNA pseudouridine65 synthase